MLVFYQAALTFCAVLLLGTGLCLEMARRSGNKRHLHMLHLLRLGLILSACSYLLRIVQPSRLGHGSFLSFLFCLFGTALIWLSFREHWKMQQERRIRPSRSGIEAEAGPAASPLTELPPGLPSLTFHAQQSLRYAQDEALRRCLPYVDTEHLLLGLLRTPQSAGVFLLHRLGVGLEKVHLEVMACAASNRRNLENVPALTPTSPQLTERAQQVIVLAGQEARRFERASIGTEHLLLGLVLMGKGKAASVLFGEGVTVDSIRNAILETKQR